MPRSKSFCAMLVALSGVTFAGSTASADEASDTAAARLLGADGVTLADAGDCQQANEKLRRAEELHHAPTTAGRLGECEIGVGKLLQGTERLQRLLREPLPADAPAPFVEAIARSRRVLDRALPRIATMRIGVKAPAHVVYKVRVDGENLSEALVDADRPTDPGRHVIEAVADGFITSKQEVVLNDGQSTSVSLELVPDPNAPAPGSAKPPVDQRIASPPATTSSSEKIRSGPGAGPIVALSLGGVGLAAGIAAGTIVAVDASDLSKSCGSTKTCPMSKQSEISAAKTWATVSTVGFAVAGAGLVTGIVLLLAGNHKSDTSTEARIQPVVGPLYLGCEGAF